jgi:hypothetical protein
MDNTITAGELIQIVQKSDLDETIKKILVRDIQSEGVNEFLIEQVIAYCDNAIEIMKKRQAAQNPGSQNPA